MFPYDGTTVPSPGGRVLTTPPGVSSRSLD